MNESSGDKHGALLVAGTAPMPEGAQNFMPEGEEPARILFVASTGGHLAELVLVASTLQARSDSLWITFDSPQSRSLLADRRTLFLPYVSPRDVFGVVRTFWLTAVTLRRERFDYCVSTGAAVALGVLLWSKIRRIPGMYVESVSRVEGPSVTGRLVRTLRLAATFTQHASWTSNTWQFTPSVLSTFTSAPKECPPPSDAKLKIFVTLGTIKPYRFDALIDTMLTSGMVGDNTEWQLGSTVRNALPGRVHNVLTPEQFDEICQSADVVVTHAGVGNLLSLFAAGVHPVVVPRRGSRGEHVDDHQIQIARLVKDLGVATVCEADSLTEKVIRAAAARKTVPHDQNACLRGDTR